MHFRILKFLESNTSIWHFREAIWFQAGQILWTRPAKRTELFANAKYRFYCLSFFKSF